MYHLYLAAAGGGGSKSYSQEAVENALQQENLDPEKAQAILEAIQQNAAQAGGEGSWAILILFFCLAIGVSFFCSVWEAVLLSVTRPYIASLKKKKPKASETLETLKSRIERPLISILTLNTIAHTMGSMGVAAEFSKITGGGIWDKVCSAGMTIAILVASEIIPKNLGARYWKSWAPWVGTCLHWLSIVMSPIVRSISFFSKGGHSEDTFSRDELTVMAEMGRMEGGLEEDESRILTNLLTLNEVSVEDVMTPRVVVFALKHKTTVKEFLKEHGESEFSRIPVYETNRDNVNGFVLKDDILLAAARDRLDEPISNWKRDVAMISEHTKLPEAFESLREHKHHVAVVIDEFGGMTGLVTMEDIVETLVGVEILDESDSKSDLQAFARKLWKTRSQRKGIHYITTEKEESEESAEAEPVPEETTKP